MIQISKSNLDDSLARVATLCAPMKPADLYGFLVKNGFSENGYLEANEDLRHLAASPFGLFENFCEQGIFERRHFRMDAQGLELSAILKKMSCVPIANEKYVLALMSAFSCVFLNQKLFHDTAIVAGTPRESADGFTDCDIKTMLACEEFGAIPYFVFGDSHSRLYQHPGLLFEDGWLLPISVTCGGGSARGLLNPNSRHKYGDRLHRFFERIRNDIARGRKCFFKFGQIDLEYLFTYRWSQEGYAQFNEEKFNEYGEETIRRYTFFLSSLIPKKLRSNIFVCSISLPALADNSCRESYARGIFIGMSLPIGEMEKFHSLLRNMEIPDIFTRSRLHLEFNVRLKKAAEAEGFRFVNDATLFWDKNTKKVGDIFIARGRGQDVHIDRAEPTLALIGPMIHKLVTT